MATIIQNESRDLYTCISCRVGFKEFEHQREHYKTDWHRYNLKRKVADLPPVTVEDFAKKILAQKNLINEAQSDTHRYCKPCRKNFGNEKAFENHLNSKKHKEIAANYVESDDLKDEKAEEKMDDDDIEEVDSDEWNEDFENPIDNNECLFCSVTSKNFYQNLEHMTTAHSFFIPDIEFCTDVEGLLQYLGEKVAAGFMCLWCNDRGRTFHSMEAAKQHMIDKGHCRMLHEGLALAEYTDYYDYSSSYPDGEETTNPDEEVEIDTLDSSEFQLVLPSGIKVGHRSLLRYYKQNLTGHQAVVPSKNNKKLHKVLATYRALGWSQADQKIAMKKARDIHFMKRMQSKLYMKLGMKQNKFQPHFRDRKSVV